MAARVKDPENPTLDDFKGQIRELDRRLKSIDGKMNQLHARSPDVKRFVAYMQVMDEYRKLLGAYSQEAGFRFAMEGRDEG